MPIYAGILIIIGGANSNSFAYVLLLAICMFTLVETLFRVYLCQIMQSEPRKDLIEKFVKYGISSDRVLSLKTRTSFYLLNQFINVNLLFYFSYYGFSLMLIGYIIYTACLHVQFTLNNKYWHNPDFQPLIKAVSHK